MKKYAIEILIAGNWIVETYADAFQKANDIRLSIEGNGFTARVRKV